MMAMNGKLLLRLVGAVALPLALAACGSSSSSSGTTTTLAPVTAAPSIAGTTMVINGKTVTVPREEYAPDRPINGQTDQGQQVILTSKGALPLTLVTPPNPTVTWTNLTKKTVSILFAAVGTKSGPIAPGKSWSYHVTTGSSIGYVVSNGTSGQIAIDQLPLPPLPTTTSP